MPSHTPSLPADVLRLIFEEVSNGLHDERQWLLDRTSDSPRTVALRDLGASSLVCRAWRDVCYPLQWRSISLNLDAVSVAFVLKS